MHLRRYEFRLLLLFPNFQSPLENTFSFLLPMIPRHWFMKFDNFSTLVYY